MSNFEKYLKEEDIYEMSTISPKDHNFGVDVKLHILQPGDRQLQHGPRVKCLKPNSPYNFSISLNENPDKIMVIGDYKKLITTKELNHLVNLIKKYRIPFLNMWYDAYMSQREFLEEINEINRGFTIELRNNMRCRACCEEVKMKPAVRILMRHQEAYVRGFMMYEDIKECPKCGERQ